MFTRRHAVLAVLMLIVTSVVARAEQPPRAADPGQAWDEQLHGPLPRWREGGTPAVDPHQPLTPYAVPMPIQVPTAGLIESPPEYAPCAGVIFRYSSGAWPSVVTDCVAALTGDPSADEIAWVVVSSVSQQNTATSQFAAAGADLSKVEFIVMPTDSIWLRDYGPHYAWQGGTRVTVDSHYYPGRPRDNFIPTLTADDYFLIPSYDIGLYYSGGNFQPGPDRTGYVTSLIRQDNFGFGDAFIAELYQTYQGIDTLHIFPRLPSSVDATGHIDMWMYLVDDDTVIISEFIPGSNATAIAVTEEAAAYFAGIGFEVFRVPDHNGYHPYDSACHYTYTNAFRVNDRIFIPTYGEGNPSHLARDATALAAWQAAAPEAEIIPIDCYDIIWAAGAIHCIMMQVPRYESAVPAAHVVSPDGGEFLVTGTPHDLAWAACDDVAVPSVDLHYSTDGGATYTHAIAVGEPNDGHFDWTVPATATSAAMVRVTAHADDANWSEAFSADVFTIRSAPQTVYDFDTGAGVDKWAWGHQTSNWSGIGNVRYPVAGEVSAASYAAMAAPDATGGDSDTSRYRSPYPSSGYETTHVMEFMIDEDPADIVDIGILWEGYGDDCTQMELYVWDDVEGDWGDGYGLHGENRFMDNFAGNRDASLRGQIYSDFERYVDADGRLTILLYGERYGDRSFHDYVSVTVTHGVCPTDLDGDGAIGVTDLLTLLAGWGPNPGHPADFDGDGDVGVTDLLAVLAEWGPCAP